MYRSMCLESKGSNRSSGVLTLSNINKFSILKRTVKGTLLSAPQFMFNVLDLRNLQVMTNRKSPELFVELTVKNKFCVFSRK